MALFTPTDTAPKPKRIRRPATSGEAWAQAPKLGILQPEPRHHPHILSIATAQATCYQCDWVGPLRTSGEIAGDQIVHSEALVDWCNHHRSC